MNSFSKAPRHNFKFGGNLSYFSLCLTDNLTMTNFLHYPPTFKWTKCSTSNMFSKAPRGQIKKVIVIWYEFIWLSFIFKCWCCLWIDVCSFTYKLRPLKCRIGDQNMVALIFLTFSFKCPWYILPYSEAVVRKCSVKRVFLNISQNS